MTIVVWSSLEKKIFSKKIFLERKFKLNFRVEYDNENRRNKIRKLKLQILKSYTTKNQFQFDTI